MSSLKKIKSSYFFMLVMFLVFSFNTITVKAAADVSSDGISVTGITSTTANVDWSGVSASYSDYTINSWTVTWWSAIRGYNTIVEDSTVTSATLTGLPSGSSILIEVYPNYIDSYGESGQGYKSVWFDTDGATDLSVDIGNDTPAPTPTTPEPTPTPSQPDIYSGAVTLSTPTVSKVVMGGGKLSALAVNVDANTAKLEWRLIDVKNKNKVVKTDTSYSTVVNMYSVGRKVYAIQCRSVGYDSDYNYVYSNWSASKYVVAQPKVSTNKKNLKKNSVTISFKKIKGVKNYTIYMRKKGAKKWTKVKTTSSSKCKVTKFKGKTINTYKTNYEFCVVSNAKIGKKTYKSGKYETIRTKYYVY